MIANISKLIWCNRQGDTIYVLEKGLVFRPKTFKNVSYKAEYDALLKYINNLLAEESK